ncbi:gamma-glutamyl phosphate reductase [Klebsiella pneumoniae]|nr:gamma-glutamyl phosphate reductase [Klebsiella pneumoniae]
MLEKMGIAAKAASWQLALLSSREKNQVLEKIADYLEAQTDDILRANAEDLAEARANGLSEAMLDRLALTPARLSGIASDVAPGVQSGRSGRPGDRRRAAGQRSAY